MLAVVIVCVVLLPIVGLVFYVVHRSKPGRFKLSASVLKFMSVSIEVESDERQRPELPHGTNDLDTKPLG